MAPGLRAGRRSDGFLLPGRKHGPAHPGSTGRRRILRRPAPTPRLAFRVDGPEHSEPVGEGVEIAGPVDTVPFETRHLEHPKSSLGHPDIDEGLHLEPVSPEHLPRIVAI